MISLGAYEPWIQDLVTPAQYWHDPFNQTHFLVGRRRSYRSSFLYHPNGLFFQSGSHYLADINNEREEKSPGYRSQLEGLEDLVLVMWDDDTTIVPR